MKHILALLTALVLPLAGAANLEMEFANPPASLLPFGLLGPVCVMMEGAPADVPK